jgi:transposase-like protein
MSKKSRRVFSAPEKAKVALATLREAQTVNEIAAEREVNANS